jgi:hypothetical protein
MIRLSKHTTHKHSQQFIWFRTTKDSAWREVDIPYAKTYILSDRCPDRHGVSGVLRTIGNKRHEHHHHCGNEQPVSDTSFKEIGKEKSAEDTRFNRSAFAGTRGVYCSCTDAVNRDS